MLFWKKNIAKEIIGCFHSIVKLLKIEEKFTEKKNKSIKFLNKINGKISLVEHDILERAMEQKSKPWIDVRFDPEIDKLAHDETDFLQKLKKDMLAYATDLEKLTSHDELIALLEMICEEVKIIEKRDDGYIKKIGMWERETLRVRLSASSEEMPAKRTKDGISWGNIAKVVRELGGTAKRNDGAHRAEIIFPRSRPIPLSTSNSGIFANEICERLGHLYPIHKVPSIASVIDGFRRGTIVSRAA